MLCYAGKGIGGDLKLSALQIEKNNPLNYHQTLHAPLMQHNIGINWSITKIENTTDCHRLKSKDISKENSIQNVILMYSVWSEGRAIFKNA